MFFSRPPLLLPEIVLRFTIDSQLLNPSVRLHWWVLGVLALSLVPPLLRWAASPNFFFQNEVITNFLGGLAAKILNLTFPCTDVPPVLCFFICRCFLLPPLVCVLYTSFHSPLHFLEIFSFLLRFYLWVIGVFHLRDLEGLHVVNYHHYYYYNGYFPDEPHKILILEKVWNTRNIESPVAKLARHSWPWPFNKKFFLPFARNHGYFFSPFLRLFEEILLFQLTWSRLRTFPVPSPLCLTYRGHLKICFPYGNRAFFQPHV